MAPSSPPQLSLAEKLDLIPAISQALGSFLYYLIISPFRGKAGADTYWQHAAFAGIRTSMTRLSLAQSAWVNPTTEQLYLDASKSKDVEPQIVNLPSGANAFWIGDKNTREVIIYYHGGGYVFHAASAHFGFLDTLHSTLNTAGKSVSFLVLDYSLAPEARYPTQLIQGVDVLSFVLSTGRKPSDIILAGDSAGGNLTVGVVAHLTHPHPDLRVERLHLNEPLRAVVLLSPWISFSTHFESWTTNKYKDYCPAELSETASEAWRGRTALDNYNEPILAPSSFWEGLQVKDILITVGGFEVGADAIKQFAKNLEAGHPSTTTVVLPNEYHVAPVVDRLIGIKGENETEKAVKAFLVDRV